mmetsp:Transcript_27941/g.30536  ORF Transcript_27941/g.30536 Transcript_27941/m.30536 type:complete len:280 (-) Transcript_27941:76-915(-)
MIVDLLESEETFETFDTWVDQMLGENKLSETTTILEPSFDFPNLANNSILIPCTKPAKKKKKRSSTHRTDNPKYIPAIRILRRDIRRKYAEMLTNVLNSYDLDLHRRFLQEFGNPDLIQVFRSYPPDLLEKLSRKPHNVGIDSLIEGISRQYLAIPDIVFQLSDVKVCQRLNTPGSKIVASSMVRGTMLYSIVRTQKYTIQDNNYQQVPSEKEDNSMFATGSLKHDDHVLLELLEKQIDYCMEGIVTISLDDQHRFVSICIEAEKVDQYQREIQLIQYQ